jgi:hypothetical protein
MWEWNIVINYAGGGSCESEGKIGSRGWGERGAPTSCCDLVPCVAMCGFGDFFERQRRSWGCGMKRRPCGGVTGGQMPVVCLDALQRLPWAPNISMD